MTRGRRTIRLAKWAGVGMCILIAVAWAVSMRWAFGVDVGTAFRAMVESGLFIASWSDSPTDGNVWFSRSAMPRDLPPLFAWRPYEDVFVYVRLWLLLVLLALPTALLFWLDRRKPRPGFCATCGYDLTGNVSGVCPECGEKM